MNYSHVWQDSGGSIEIGFMSLEQVENCSLPPLNSKARAALTIDAKIIALGACEPEIARQLLELNDNDVIAALEDIGLSDLHHIDAHKRLQLLLECICYDMNESPENYAN